MKGLITSSVVFGLLLSAATLSQASSRSIVRLHRDTTYEQNLRYSASVDNAITPARVLRWMRGMMGYSTRTRPSNLEFQPVLNVHDSRKQIVAQFAYKF
jgi:hypothetical protein